MIVTLIENRGRAIARERAPALVIVFQSGMALWEV
jgi:hypothetical protein